MLSALMMFRLLPRGFSNCDLRNHCAPLLGNSPQNITPGQATYQMRRLRLHGPIERIPDSHRYRVTGQGWRTSLFWIRAYGRILCAGLALIIPQEARDEASTNSIE
jgi:hypothetical protein